MAVIRRHLRHRHHRIATPATTAAIRLPRAAYHVIYHIVGHDAMSTLSEFPQRGARPSPHR